MILEGIQKGSIIFPTIYCFVAVNIERLLYKED